MTPCISSFFYATWSPLFLLLLYSSVVVDYVVGRVLARRTQRRGLVLAASLAFNLGCLGFFKYANFAAQNVSALLGSVGVSWQPKLLDISLPLGISFCTFLTLSYVIDVYHRRVEPERSLLRYGVFVMFFPHLIAGPILRAQEFLPQLHEPSSENLRPFYGLNRIALGLVKKMVFADFLATLVEPVFAGPSEYAGYHCLIAAYGYAFQVFFDFSGYCDIALGAAALLGYRLPENFDASYLSRNPSEFWRRWHITLSTWFRDYVFLKVCFVVSRRLGGGRFFGLRSDHVVYAVGAMVVMTLCGLWHGANWTFVVWGAMQGLLLVGHRLWSGGRVIAAGETHLFPILMKRCGEPR